MITLIGWLIGLGVFALMALLVVHVLLALLLIVPSWRICERAGFSGLIYLRAQYPAIPVVIVSASDDAGTIRRSLDFGASGFIPKRFGVETLRDAIMKVMEGDVWVPPDTDLTSANDPDMTRLRDRLVTLTPQQVRVLMMLSEGLLNKQIAYELGVSEATIKAHVSAILQKLGVESRTQAVIAAAKIAGGNWRQGTPSA